MTTIMDRILPPTPRRPAPADGEIGASLLPPPTPGGQYKLANGAHVRRSGAHPDKWIAFPSPNDFSLLAPDGTVALFESAEQAARVVTAELEARSAAEATK